MIRDRVITLSGARMCADCRVRGLCLPGGISGHEVKQLEELITHRAPLHRGDSLFKPRDRFSTLYAVRSGSLKGIVVSGKGRQQVSGFHFPGDILGFDAIDIGYHIGGAVALETTSVCELPFDPLRDLAHKIQNVQDHLVRIMSRELSTRDRMYLALANGDADQKLAGFLLDLSARHALRGYSSTEFNLSMSRRDIAGYLCLASATVSRAFARLQKEKILAVDRTRIKILRRDVLTELSEGTQDDNTHSSDQMGCK